MKHFPLLTYTFPVTKLGHVSILSWFGRSSMNSDHCAHVIDLCVSRLHGMPYVRACVIYDYQESYVLDMT